MLLCGLGASLTASAVADEVTVPAPIVDYDFTSAQGDGTAVRNDVSGSTFGDARIVAADGTSAEGTWQDDALQMEGDRYVRLPDGILKGKASATVSVTVRNDQFNSSGAWTYLWQLGGTGQTAKGSWTASTHTSLYSSITSKANGDGETYFSASENLSMSKFQTLTATIDGTTRETKLYIDGRLVGSTVASATPADFQAHDWNVIGESRYPGVGDALFHGAIRSFAVYDETLTQDQIARTLDADGVSALLDAQADALDVPSSANADFTLATRTTNASVSWTSSDATTIEVADDGTAAVTLPSEDTTVTLTATLTPDSGIADPSEPVVRTFDVLVPKALDRDALREAMAAALTVDGSENVKGDLLLPRTVSLDAYGISGDVTWTSSDDKVVSIVAPAPGDGSVAAKVTRPASGAAEVTLTATIASEALGEPVVKTIDLLVQAESAGDDAGHARVTVHDPSIIKSDGVYYSFGSHRAWAKSTDLQHWQYFENNLSRDYEEIFADIWNAWPKQDSNPDVAGNMWAPEIIWNPTMNKWCMYMSINGGGFPYQKSVMTLLTADSLDGDWTYVGPVIYSGFSAANASATDVYRVLGEGADLTRYASLQDTGLNMIDASVHYDGDELWMAFGSWFGGIWMVRLDPSTGLRDYATTYPTVENVSDGYYGHKLAGGHGNSGEGATMIHQGDYWYLFLSYGGLSQTGGYQIREFRSKDIEGPYVDQNGNPAVYTSSFDDTKVNRGLRILSSYDQPGSENVKTAQGGNSVFADEDGTVYNVFHTRFVRTEGNLEEHQVRVQQLVMSPDGWLVSAPYEKSGAVRQGAYDAADIAGEFDVVVHDPTSYYAGGDADAAGIYHARKVTLAADGTVTGAARGTWTLDGDAVTIHIEESDEGVLMHGDYTAAVGEQTAEDGTNRLFLTGVGGDVFTAVGSDVESNGNGAAAFWATRAYAASDDGKDDGSDDGKDDGKDDEGAADKGDGQSARPGATADGGKSALSATGAPIAGIAMTGLALAGIGLTLMRRRRA
ncbi:fused endo-1,5-alpha-L-arabinosidase and LamG-containing protein [Bifidobacterium samirii]|uniref:Fused endo-1,5-alpha-L-arabinosidase and LamG-containing protein n=2 Tax=Bifidobacterium samirii TaxID=2306974 RepID=A0A430FU03_9BIFI|nr:fused endo-1,5-alpha-L-arabinosidase and LamG-containing protein [Bifidobacterium samirii]